MKILSGLLTVCLLAFSTMPGLAEGQLATEFQNPPVKSGMASYWWVFGPAWTKPEIRRELQVLKKAGIDRILLFPLYPYELDNPAKGIHNQNYLSPEFLDTLRYALVTANDLGVSVDLVMGTGWPYGGPEIPASLSPKRIYSQTIPVAGSAGTSISVKIPPPAAGSRIVDLQLVQKDPASRVSPVELMGKLSSGSVRFTLPQGAWDVMVFLEGPTLRRHTVIFASAGAGGNVIDPLSKEAVQLYLKTVCDKLAAAGKGHIRAMYSPSLEVYGASWTDGFLSDFKRLRGYDLRPHLSALFRNQPETPQIRHDYWETISELANTHYVGAIAQWSHDRGFKFQSESYGEPPVTQLSYSSMDYPMGEEFDWQEFNMVRWTSSAAHFFNHPIISDEAYTWLNDPVRYNETLEELKRASDAVFVAGANRLVAHGYGYSPPSAGSPGWGYFAGAMLTEHQPWWPYFHFLSSYAHRTGFMLSQGSPVAEVLVYLPEGDLYAEHPPGEMKLAWWVEGRLDRHKAQLPDYGIPQGVFDFKSDLVSTVISNGYSLDGIDHSVLAATGSVAKGHFHIGQGNYSIMILPGIDGLPVADLERIAEFCRQGGTLITTLNAPKLAYGYLHQTADARRLADIKKELYGGMDLNQNYQLKRVGEGRSIFVKNETGALQKALHEAGPADIDVHGGLAEIGFAHRHTDSHDIYFLANFSSHPRAFEASFRAGNHTPEIWNPMTGETEVARQFEYQGNRTDVRIRLKPYGSTFVVFGSGQMTPPAKELPVSSQPQHPILLDNTWKLRWIGLDTQPVEMPALKSWTDFPRARYFSGEGMYETTVEVPVTYLHSGSRILLNMGDVRNTAEVWINGLHVGVAWKIPYVLNITDYLRPGRNEIRIKVANLLINHVLNQPVKNYSAVEAKYPGLKVPAPREKEAVKAPLPSGLLGPVVIEQVGE